MQPLYIAGASPLHQLHPLTKLAGLALLIVLTSTLPAPALALALCCLIIALAALAGVIGPLLRTALLVVAPLLLSLLIIQGVLFPPTRLTPLLDVAGFIIWADGLWFALRIALRLLALAMGVMLLVMTTHPGDLVQALSERGLPRSIGHLLIVALQLVPDMSARASAIQDVQRSRGLETQGPIRRLRALGPLVGPLVVGALLDVEERAMALESRAFAARGPKTALRELHDSRTQMAARWLILVAIVALVAARLAGLIG